MTDRIVRDRGSVQRTHQLQQGPGGGGYQYHVSRYGVVADGVTDDRIALQAAEDAAEGNLLVFPDNSTICIKGDFFKGNSIWSGNNVTILIDNRDNGWTNVASWTGDYAGISRAAIINKASDVPSNPYKASFPTTSRVDIRGSFNLAIRRNDGYGVSTTIAFDNVDGGDIWGLTWSHHADTETYRLPWNGPNFLGNVSNLNIYNPTGLMLANTNEDMFWMVPTRLALSSTSDTVTISYPSIPTNYLRGYKLQIEDGTGAGFSSIITANSSVGNSLTFTVETPFSTPLDTTSVIGVLGAQGGWWIRTITGPISNINIYNPTLKSNQWDEPLAIWTDNDYDITDVHIWGGSTKTYDSRNVMARISGGTQAGAGYMGQAIRVQYHNHSFKTETGSTFQVVNGGSDNSTVDCGLIDCSVDATLRASGFWGWDGDAIYTGPEMIARLNLVRGGRATLVADLGADNATKTYRICSDIDCVDGDFHASVDTITSKGFYFAPFYDCRRIHGVVAEVGGDCVVSKCDIVKDSKLHVSIFQDCTEVTDNEIYVDATTAERTLFDTTTDAEPNHFRYQRNTVYQSNNTTFTNVVLAIRAAGTYDIDDNKFYAGYSHWGSRFGNALITSFERNWIIGGRPEISYNVILFGFLSEYRFNGIRADNTNQLKLHYNVTDKGGGVYEINMYKDSACTQLVASGSRTGNGRLVLTEENGSGINGRIDIIYNGNVANVGGAPFISFDRSTSHHDRGLSNITAEVFFDYALYPYGHIVRNSEQQANGLTVAQFGWQKQAFAGESEADWFKLVSIPDQGKYVNGLTEKTTPSDADMIGLMDSAASNLLKKLSWANLKSAFAAIYLAVANIDDTPVNGETSAPISSNWAYDHENDTSAHGVTGAVVGTTDTQTLSSKTLTNYKETLYSTTTAGNVTIDLANGNVQRFILDAARQFTMPADPGAYGQSFILILECATYSPTWNTSPVIEWLTSDGTAPTLVTTANLVNVLTFIWDDIDSRWLGFLAGKETA